jgi:hypothetical protein
MSDAQLTAAARLTSAMPIQKKKTRPPIARPASVALKATPAPARGPEDELLFDPDEESFGEGGPGAGYDVGDVNAPIGIQQGVDPDSATTTVPAGATEAPAADREPEEPLVIDLEDDPTTPPPQAESGWGLTLWLLLIGGLVVCGFCLVMLWQRGSSGSATSTQQSSSSGLGFDPYAGLGTGGLGGIGSGSLV